jgi:hypothetical protein
MQLGVINQNDGPIGRAETLLRRGGRAALVSRLFLIGALAIMPPVKASRPVSSSFWSTCISVFDLQKNFTSKDRDDLAARVARSVQVTMEQAEHGRKVLSAPNCIRTDQVGFDRQLFLDLSVKRQTVKLDDRDWSLVIAGGVARNGLFQDRDLQPIVVLKQDQITDDDIVRALMEFVDRGVVEAVRQGRQK